jgi:hypothetical protein
LACSAVMRRPLAASSSAAAPLTKGAAMEVPAVGCAGMQWQGKFWVQRATQPTYSSQPQT